LGWVEGPNFSFVTGLVGRLSWWVGLGWITENGRKENADGPPGEVMSPNVIEAPMLLRVMDHRFCTLFCAAAALVQNGLNRIYVTDADATIEFRGVGVASVSRRCRIGDAN